jgi:hypothetical protein
MDVTVLVPLYNGVEFLPECIASVRAQTYPRWRVLIGVNGHPEGSPVHEKARALEDERVRVLHLARARGAPQALNALAAAATSDVVCLLDADDAWAPTKLEAQLPHLADGHDVVGTFCRYVGERVDVPVLPAGRVPDEAFRRENPLIHSSVMMRRADVRFRDEYLYDYDLWLRLHAEGRRFYNHAVTLTRHRVHAGSHFNSRPGAKARKAELLKRHARAIVARPTGRARAPGPLALPRPVYFVAPGASALSALVPRTPRPDACAAAPFLRALGESRHDVAWLLQTYLQLAARGLPVALRETFVEDAVCVHLSPLSAPWGDPWPDAPPTLGGALRRFPALDAREVGHRSFRVALSLDRPVAHTGHVRIFQNPVAARAYDGLFVPHWPQPGLVPRDPARGDRLEDVCFMGLADNLDPVLRSDAFRARLLARGFRWHMPGALGWHDYRHCDALVAVRGRAVPQCMLRLKPASKLVNAWRAGVPAVLGAEPAYAALRQSALDYVEAESEDDVLRALVALRSQPGRVRAMREHGRVRSRAFDEDAVCARWVQVLAGPVESAYRRWCGRRFSAEIDALGYALSAARELTTARRFWRRYTEERGARCA